MQIVNTGLKVPILMYHEVADESEIDLLSRLTQHGYIVLRREFRAQMEFLATAGFTSISLDQLWRWVDHDAPLPHKPIVITFDDGFAGNHRWALPILNDLGLTATFFVVTNRIGDPHMLTWQDLTEMCCHSMSIESHTANHPLLSTIGETRTREELTQSKLRIEDALGTKVRFLSLPNGDSNLHYVKIAQEAGYLGGCGSQFGMNTRLTDRYFWHRIAIKQTLPFASFCKLVVGQFDAMLYQAAKAAGKAIIARSLGKKTYDRLYNLAFGVQEQDKSRQP